MQYLIAIPLAASKVEGTSKQKSGSLAPLHSWDSRLGFLYNGGNIRLAQINTLYKSNFAKIWFPVSSYLTESNILSDKVKISDYFLF